MLFLRGEIDVASAPMLEATIEELCAAGAEEIVLDLSAVEFVDSSGLSAILHGKSLCERHQCAYSLTPAQRPVERMFDMTALKGRLRFRPRSRGTNHSAADASRPREPAPTQANAAWRAAGMHLRDTEWQCPPATAP